MLINYDNSVQVAWKYNFQPIILTLQTYAVYTMMAQRVKTSTVCIVYE